MHAPLSVRSILPQVLVWGLVAAPSLARAQGSAPPVPAADTGAPLDEAASPPSSSSAEPESAEAEPSTRPPRPPPAAEAGPPAPHEETPPPGVSSAAVSSDSTEAPAPVDSPSRDGAPDESLEVHVKHGIYGSLVAATIKNLGFVDRDSNVSFRRSTFASTAGAGGGYEVVGTRGHRGAGFSAGLMMYLPMGLGTLEAGEGADPATASNVSALLYSIDFAALFYPLKNVNLGGRVVVGITGVHASYDFDPGDLEELHEAGHKHYDHVDTSVGLGACWGFVRHLHGLAEVRWVTMDGPDEDTESDGDGSLFSLEAPMVSLGVLVD